MLSGDQERQVSLELDRAVGPPAGPESSPTPLGQVHCSYFVMLKYLTFAKYLEWHPAHSKSHKCYLLSSSVIFFSVFFLLCFVFLNTESYAVYPGLELSV